MHYKSLFYFIETKNKLINKEKKTQTFDQPKFYYYDMIFTLLFANDQMIFKEKKKTIQIKLMESLQYSERILVVKNLGQIKYFLK